MERRPLRIALSGASSTGKSTLALALSERLGLPHIPEQARVVLAELGTDLPTLRRDPAAILDFQNRVLEHQVREETAHAAGFVSDRAVYDILTLFLVYVEAPIEVVRDFEKRVFAHAERLPYTLNVLLRPEGFAVEDDGVRTPDVKHQAYLDGHFHGLFRSWGIETHTPRGGVAARVDSVLARLAAMGFPSP